MDGVSRIGVSLEPELLKLFDDSIAQKGYVSRSEAIRDLVRDSLSEKNWKNENEYMVGVIVIVYNHTVTGLEEKMTDLEHNNGHSIRTSVHVHLDHDTCMEIMIVEDQLKELKILSNKITSIKGVLRGKLTMVSPITGNMHHISSRN